MADLGAMLYLAAMTAITTGCAFGAAYGARQVFDDWRNR